MALHATPGTTLGGFNITWSGTVLGGAEATLSRSDQPDPEYVERKGDSFPSHTVAQGPFDIASLAAIAACSFTDPCPPDPVEFTISRAVMTLNDNSFPSATHVSGDLLAAPVLRGPESLSLTATDTGSGVYRVVVTSDGTDLTSAQLPDAANRCVNVSRDDPYAFQWPQPCPLQTSGRVTIDAGALPEGQHSIGVYLEDAAGNRIELAAPSPRTIVHRGAQNGTNGGDGAVLKRVGHYHVVRSFSERRLRLHGILTRSGAPVAGALLEILAKNRNTGGRLHKIVETRTGPRGRYSVRVPAGPSRLLRVGYRAFLGDIDYTAQTDVSQRVHARIDMRAVTRHVGLRGVARFAGGLRGGFVPRRGKLIELQAFDGGRWRTFLTVRTRRNGRFRAHYAFTRVSAPRTYRFRARSRYERGYPFIVGVSRSIFVRVG